MKWNCFLIFWTICYSHLCSLVSVEQEKVRVFCYRSEKVHNILIVQLLNFWSTPKCTCSQLWKSSDKIFWEVKIWFWSRSRQVESGQIKVGGESRDVSEAGEVILASTSSPKKVKPGFWKVLKITFRSFLSMINSKSRAFFKSMFLWKKFLDFLLTLSSAIMGLWKYTITANQISSHLKLFFVSESVKKWFNLGFDILGNIRECPFCLHK